MPENGDARPAGDRAGQELNTDQSSSSPGAYRRMEARADLVLRVAWLTEHAQRLYAVDPGGQLSAQLLDLRDVLESMDDEGRWSA